MDTTDLGIMQGALGTGRLRMVPEQDVPSEKASPGLGPAAGDHPLQQLGGAAAGALPDFPARNNMGSGHVDLIKEERKMKTVFWNANAWNAQNCEKVADVVKRANADVLCITDARMDEGRARYMHGYLSTLKRLTGKNWRGKMEPMPARRTKCSVGVT